MVLRGFFISGADALRQEWEQSAVATRGSGGERKNFKIAFAREDDAEEAPVGRDGEVAERKPVEDGLRRGRDDGNFCAGRLRDERRNLYPNDVAGFSFDGAFEEDAIFIGRPADYAETDSKPDKVIGNRETAHFEDFSIDEISDFLAAG